MTKMKNSKELVNDMRYGVPRHCEERSDEAIHSIDCRVGRRLALNGHGSASALCSACPPRNDECYYAKPNIESGLPPRNDENHNGNPPTLTLPLRWGGNLDGNSGILQRLLNDKNLKTYRLNVLTTSKKAAFTLAEVLITLAVIGIVAAMTIPTLVQNYQEKVTVTKLKKAYSIFSQAAVMVVNEYGWPDTWGMKQDDKASVEIAASKIKPFLRIIDDCGTDTCDSYTTYWKYLNNQSENIVTNFSNDFYYKLRLQDGLEIFLRPSPEAVAFFVDINGKQAPNIMGKDIFQVGGLSSSRKMFTLTGEGMSPNDPSVKWWSRCSSSGGEGWNCAGWVIMKENMDYLKCPDELDWNGKTKCSD